MIPRFRAWDKEFKEMVQVDALVFDEQIIKATYKNGNVVKEDLKKLHSHAIHRLQRQEWQRNL